MLLPLVDPLVGPVVVDYVVVLCLGYPYVVCFCYVV
jgi:hypothetical protein